jgi:hypothetical protein
MIKWKGSMLPPIRTENLKVRPADGGVAKYRATHDDQAAHRNMLISTYSAYTLS